MCLCGRDLPTHRDLDHRVKLSSHHGENQEDQLVRNESHHRSSRCSNQQQGLACLAQCSRCSNMCLGAPDELCSTLARQSSLLKVSLLAWMNPLTTSRTLGGKQLRHLIVARLIDGRLAMARANGLVGAMLDQQLAALARSIRCGPHQPVALMVSHWQQSRWRWQRSRTASLLTDRDNRHRLSLRATPASCSCSWPRAAQRLLWH